jgi:hypothetical protein
MEGWISQIIADFTPGAAGIWVVASMLIIHFVREWRATRKLSLEDRIARRDGYAKQVESLMAENRALRAEMHSMNEHHEAHRRLCHQETDQLRQMIIRLEDELAGLKRARAGDAIELARAVKATDRG